MLLERNMSAFEFESLVNHKIPVFDRFGDYHLINRMAIVEKKGRFGVVDGEPAIVLDLVYDEIEFTPNGVIIALSEGKYKVFDRNGRKICFLEFDSKDKAQECASMF